MLAPGPAEGLGCLLPRGTARAAVERKAAAFDPLNLIRLTPA
jgi:hypothetical protein